VTARRRIAATVHGMVQGVGFRRFVERTALGLGLDGWVANRSDGAVELVAEGDPAAIAALVAELEEGPPGAWVDEVRLHDEVPTGARTGFGIRARAHAGD
jgi:acylphosphatase